ncbi:peptidase domain-containing ABC transporter [Serratia ureilytica]|uniref:Peptidase domain-containing ABC transporter n=1 Tax=Serratia ureilytica TaxID=300181 RepID=A0A9X9G2Y8_9GAMM|nr:peptidase domain-containing ABC transporter [Serratia ureilytica]MBN5215408.1 peptidase domain-containing ABC transporter [Serratia ureilytica]MCU6263493.1 peptidase domain-containing ABC transporter [Serratia ureilytica]QNL01118.1 peptidase domain-containing ABC transporter [Serratia ureilytica]TXE30686.1 peptidase domain-containing ABC transporter [Serratia ureilytica]UMK53457.1 peptidase domain-containing ABC transporter [Serratia ureilytica]
MFFSWQKTPLVLQSEMNECGLACLAMVAGYFGKRIDLASARTLHGVSSHGMTLRDLITAFERVGMTARASRVELDELRSLSRPAILHWSFNHFVVLVKVTRRGAVILDPAIGRRSISLRELSDKFTGILMEAWPAETFDKKPLERNVTVSDLFRGVRGLRRIFTGVLMLSVLVELLSIAVPAASQFTIDTLVRSSDREGIFFVGIVVISALLIKSAFSVVRAWILMNLRYTLGVKWAEMFFNRLIRLTLSFFEKRHTGDIASRFQSLTAIQEAFTADMVASLLDAIVIVISMAIIFSYSPVLAIGPLIAACVYAALKVGLFSTYRNRKIEHIAFEAVQSSHFLETVRAIGAIKMLNLTPVRRREWVNHVVNSTHAGNQLFKLDLLTNTAAVLLVGFSGIYVLSVGAIGFDKGITTGALLAVMLYADMVMTRTVKLVNAVSDFCLVSMHSQRLTDVAVSPVERDEGEHVSLQLNGHIVIRNLAFRHSHTERNIFEGINLEVMPGENVAIVGPSGCGKSTFLHVLAGLYESTEGDVFINNVGLSGMSKRDIREHVAFVMQDDKLLAGTIQQNITGFTASPDVERMAECANHAAIDEEISAFPQGYDSMIGDIGSTLSGGQRQRISIARALYRQPRVLLLDEATSDLDIDNEKKITRAIGQLPITRIFVAHRPEMIKSADRVFNLHLNTWVKQEKRVAATMLIDDKVHSS